MGFIKPLRLGGLWFFPQWNLGQLDHQSQSFVDYFRIVCERLRHIRS